MAKAKTTTRKTTTSKNATKSRTTKAAKTKAGDQEVVMDRRRADRRTKAAPSKSTKPAELEEKKEVETEQPKMERRAKVNRRRQIDPTTCERDYTNDEIEFMQALDAYKRSSGRMFPTCSEILEVIRDLGYTRSGAMGEPVEEIEEMEEGDSTPAFTEQVPAIEG